VGHSRPRSGQPQARACPLCPDSDRTSKRSEMSRRANTGSDLLSVIKVAEKKGREAIASSPICG
jgi:hypothetical protein